MAGGGERADTKARSDTTTSQMDDVDLDVSDHHQVRKGSQWQKDGEAKACCKCAAIFTVRVRRHHCRCCGQIFCDACTQAKVALPDLGHEMPVRVCDHCLYTVSRAMARQYVFNCVGVGRDTREMNVQCEHEVCVCVCVLSYALKCSLVPWYTLVR